MKTPIGFLDFLALVGVVPEPGQRVFWAVAADGVQPKDLTGDDREIAAELFGDVDEIPDECRRQVAVIKGADVGFSFIGGLRLLHRALTATELGAPGEIRPSLGVGPDLRIGRIAVKNALGAAESVPAIKRLIDSSGTDGFTIRREGGRFTSVECLPATAGGRALRGRRYVEVLFDEAAFFRDSNYAVNDAECIRAVLPRCLGTFWYGSTPWLETSAIWQTYQRNFGHPVDALAARMPTLLVRKDPRVVALVAAERERDPQAAATEFDCLPPIAGGGLFFDGHAIDASADKSRPLVLKPRRDITRVCCADFAFVNDYSAAVVLYTDANGNVELAEHVELRPERGKPLQPSHVFGEFTELARRHGINVICTDTHYSEAAREFFSQRQIKLFQLPGAAQGKEAQHVAARDCIHEGRFRMPWIPRLVQQLKEITAAPRAGGGLLISSPRRRGHGHGDLASAVIGGIYILETNRRRPRVRRDLTNLYF